MTPVDTSSVPQNIVQFYGLLLKLEYQEADLLRIRSAFELAQGLFTGQFRANGKAFLEHLVGTAAILAREKAPVDLVIAGLLHACYSNGDFGYRSLEKKRALLKRVAGPPAENLVYEYRKLKRDETTIRGALQNFHSLRQLERDLYTLMVANELEDWMDCAMRYCKKSEDPLPSLSLIIELAAKLGLQNAEAALKEASELDSSAHVPESLRFDAKRAYRLPPRSYSLKLRFRILSWIRAAFSLFSR